MQGKEANGSVAWDLWIPDAPVLLGLLVAVGFNLFGFQAIDIKGH